MHRVHPSGYALHRPFDSFSYLLPRGTRTELPEKAAPGPLTRYDPSISESCCPTFLGLLRLDRRIAQLEVVPAWYRPSIRYKSVPGRRTFFPSLREGLARAACKCWEPVPRFLSKHSALVGAWYTTLYVPFGWSRNRAHMASSKTAVFPEPVGAETTRLSGEL